jgi:hypothetical protein
LFAASLGVGTQVLVIVFAVFGLALLDTFHPYNRGAMLSACVVLYALTAGISGEGGAYGTRGRRAPLLLWRAGGRCFQAEGAGWGCRLTVG